MSRLRLVLDTNVVVSALLWQGNARTSIEAAGEQQARLLSSRTLLDELAVTLAKPKLAKPVVATGLSATRMLGNYRRLVTLVATRRIERVVRDPDDYALLACAIAGRADALVTGDSDLLVLDRHKGVPIVTAAQALERLSLG